MTSSVAILSDIHGEDTAGLERDCGCASLAQRETLPLFEDHAAETGKAMHRCIPDIWRVFENWTIVS